MAPPLVSVVIPAFESEPFVAEAIASALAQTYEPVEVIVVDDGSSDGTAAAASAFGSRITLIRRQNSGPSGARNAGFAACSGKFVAFHDADDVMTSDRIEVQAAHLLANPAVGCVLGRQDLIVESGAALPYWTPGTDVRSSTWRDRGGT